MNKFLTAAFALLLSSGAAFAQAPASVQVPTTTTMNVTDAIPTVPFGATSAQNKWVTPAAITNTVGYVDSVPLTGFTLTFANGQTYYYIHPAGTLATGTFTFAPNPSDGGRACVRSSQTQTAVTIAGNTGQTIGGTAVTAMTANTTYCWLYEASVSTWYPI